MVAESYSGQMPKAGGSLCIAGGHLHSIYNRGGKAEKAGELGSEGLAGSKEESFLHSDKCTSYPIPTLCPLTMMLGYHPLLFRFKLRENIRKAETHKK